MFVLIGLVWKRFELPGEEIGERWAAFCFVACPRSALPFVILEHNWQAQLFFVCRFFPWWGKILKVILYWLPYVVIILQSELALV